MVKKMADWPMALQKLNDDAEIAADVAHRVDAAVEAHAALVVFVHAARGSTVIIAVVLRGLWQRDRPQVPSAIAIVPVMPDRPMAT